MLDRLMTHLLLLGGTVCAGINIMVDAVVVIGAVGTVGAETVVVTLLAMMFA